MTHSRGIRLARPALVVLLALVICALSTAVTAGSGSQGAAGPDLRLRKWATLARPFTPGDPITYTLVVDNLGTTTASGIVVTDLISSQVLATSYQSTVVITPTGGGNYAWDVDPLPAGASAVITICGTIDPGITLTSTILNEASVYDTADTNPDNNASSVTVRRHTAYLPLVLRSYAGPPAATPTPVNTLYGYLSFNGQPAVGKTMHIRFAASHYSYLSATTTVDSNGNYSFSNLPSLEPGQRYNGLFPGIMGPDGDGYLSGWWTHGITLYTSGQSVNLGSGDIADIVLLHPDSGSDTLPVTFQWTPRPATPSDSYSLILDNYLGDWWESPRLGYTGVYTMSSLPPGFSLGQGAYWYVRVVAPDGGSAESSHRNLVHFGLSGSAATDVESPTPVLWREDIMQ
jgi:uncharacterized repeat protein (TIGR01451 family)